MSPALTSLGTYPRKPSYRTAALVSGKGKALHAEMDPSDPEVKRKQTLLEEARKRFRMVADFESEFRREMLEDFQFRAGLQWPLNMSNERQLSGRPCLTINRLPQMIKVISNEIRQNRAAIQVNPVSDGADQDTAEVLEGMARHIELMSDAETAYDTAAEHAVTGGRGWIRLHIDWVDQKTMRQQIRIVRVPNPFSVYMDPGVIQPDYSDAKYGFLVSDLSEDDFKKEFPGHQWSPAKDFEGVGDMGDWYPESKIRVAEYFYIEEEDGALHQLSDGSTVKGGEEIPNDEQGEPLEIVASRHVSVRKVRWAKITGREVLEEGEWPGEWIPLIPVLGDEYMLNGKRQYAGIVRFSRDPQRMYNYLRSAITEAIALAPKSPWLVAEGQIENYENLYQQANVRNIAVLYYKLISANGQPAPPPQRVNAEPPIQAMTQALAQADTDLQSSSGIYRPALGDRSPDESGRAILARQKQTDTATFSYGDNQARAIKFVGRQIIGLIPHVYPEPEVVHIVKPDQTRAAVTINKTFQQGGAMKLYAVGGDEIGRYDVTVSTGPSYQSRRQEASTLLMQLVQSYPPFMTVAGDLLLRNLDIPGADEMADRWKSTLPPAMQNEDQGGQLNPQQAQQIIQQLQQQLQSAQQMLQPKLLEMQSKERIAADDRASQERVAARHDQATIVAADLKSRSAEAQKLADLEFGGLRHTLQMEHEAEQAAIELATQLPPAAQPQQQPQPQQPQQPGQ